MPVHVTDGNAARREAPAAEWRNYFRTALTTSLAREDSALVRVHALARV